MLGIIRSIPYHLLPDREWRHLFRMEFKHARRLGLSRDLLLKLRRVQRLEIAALRERRFDELSKPHGNS